MGPIATTISRLYGGRGWIALGAFAFVLLVVFPVASLALPPQSPFHL